MYEPMSREEADEVVAAIPPQPTSVTGQDAARWTEAIQVLAGAPVEQIHRMRELFLGPGAND